MSSRPAPDGAGPESGHADLGEIAVTLDVDWAPDWAIDLCADILREREVPATWLITHSSPAIDRLREDPELFELGIHPNFQAGSTHGTEPAEVIEHCIGLVPEAVTMRPHGLAMSSSILHLVASDSPIEIDLSLFVPFLAGIRPVLYSWEGSRLVRLPYYWEDDHEMELEPQDWTASWLKCAQPGLKVINFHPIHVYLNSSTMAAYKGLGPLGEVTEGGAAASVEDGPGTRTFFEGLAELLAGGCSLRVRDLAAPSSVIDRA